MIREKGGNTNVSSIAEALREYNKYDDGAASIGDEDYIIEIFNDTVTVVDDEVTLSGVDKLSKDMIVTVDGVRLPYDDYFEGEISDGIYAAVWVEDGAGHLWVGPDGSDEVTPGDYTVSIVKRVEKSRIAIVDVEPILENGNVSGYAPTLSFEELCELRAESQVAFCFNDIFDYGNKKRVVYDVTWTFDGDVVSECVIRDTLVTANQLYQSIDIRSRVYSYTDSGFIAVADRNVTLPTEEIGDGTVS